MPFQQLLDAPPHPWPGLPGTREIPISYYLLEWMILF